VALLVTLCLIGLFGAGAGVHKFLLKKALNSLEEEKNNLIKYQTRRKNRIYNPDEKLPGGRQARTGAPVTPCDLKWKWVNSAWSVDNGSAFFISLPEVTPTSVNKKCVLFCTAWHVLFDKDPSEISEDEVKHAFWSCSLEQASVSSNENKILHLREQDYDFSAYFASPAMLPPPLPNGEPNALSICSWIRHYSGHFTGQKQRKLDVLLIWMEVGESFYDELVGDNLPQVKDIELRQSVFDKESSAYMITHEITQKQQLRKYELGTRLKTFYVPRGNGKWESGLGYIYYTLTTISGNSGSLVVHDHTGYLIGFHAGCAISEGQARNEADDDPIWNMGATTIAVLAELVNRGWCYHHKSNTCRNCSSAYDKLYDSVRNHEVKFGFEFPRITLDKDIKNKIEEYKKEIITDKSDKCALPPYAVYLP